MLSRNSCLASRLKNYVFQIQSYFPQKKLFSAKSGNPQKKIKCLYFPQKLKDKTKFSFDILRFRAKVELKSKKMHNHGPMTFGCYTRPHLKLRISHCERSEARCGLITFSFTFSFFRSISKTKKSFAFDIKNNKHFDIDNNNLFY